MANCNSTKQNYLIIFRRKFDESGFSDLWEGSRAKHSIWPLSFSDRWPSPPSPSSSPPSLSWSPPSPSSSPPHHRHQHHRHSHHHHSHHQQNYTRKRQHQHRSWLQRSHFRRHHHPCHHNHHDQNVNINTDHNDKEAISDALRSVPRWRFVVAAFPHVMQCAASMLQYRLIILLVVLVLLLLLLLLSLIRMSMIVRRQHASV